MYPIRHLIDPPTSNPPPRGQPQPPVVGIDPNASLFTPPVLPHSTSAAGPLTGTAPASAPAASPSPASFSHPSSSINANTTSQPPQQQQQLQQQLQQQQQQQPPQPQLPTSLYQCAHCLRRYSRPEHLQVNTHRLQAVCCLHITDEDDALETYSNPYSREALRLRCASSNMLSKTHHSSPET